MVRYRATWRQMRETPGGGLPRAWAYRSEEFECESVSAAAAIARRLVPAIGQLTELLDLDEPSCADCGPRSTPAWLLGRRSTG